MSYPTARKGKELPTDTKTSVNELYTSDENSRIMPGKKDKFSVAKNEYEQKRIIIANIRELYSLFKNQHHGIKIGLSTFAYLHTVFVIFIILPL